LELLAFLSVSPLLTSAFGASLVVFDGLNISLSSDYVEFKFSVDFVPFFVFLLSFGAGGVTSFRFTGGLASTLVSTPLKRTS
jgi:hypothetical protein